MSLNAQTFKDAHLEAAVRTALAKPEGTLTAADLLTLTELTALGTEISDLSGLELATNLESLALGSSRIEDVTALSGLSKLTSLALSGNLISDLSPLSGLTQLQSLALQSNRISDLSPIGGLTNLSNLQFGENQVADISALSELTNLVSLNFDTNRVADISALGQLTKLAVVAAGSNRIVDVSPLAALTGLSVLQIDQNLIEDISPLSTLTMLRSATVYSNFLDINPEADDRQVIDNWGIAGRVRFEPQNPPPTPLRGNSFLHISRTNEGVLLEWETEVGVAYTLQSNRNLGAWGTFNTPVVIGDGATARIEIRLENVNFRAFRLEIER